jgi:hypothetical protein
MLKRISLVAIVALWCAFTVSSTDAQVSTWFRADFNGTGGLYNFANRFAQSATTWTTDHRATGGWNGSGGAHVVVKGCNASTGRPCNTSENQFNIGWQTPAIPWTGTTGFYRFRIKFDPNTVFTPGAFGAKFTLHGSSGSNRWIDHLMPPYANNGCTIGFESYSFMGWTPPASQWHQASHWGLPAFSRGAGPYAGFNPNVNIGWSCAPAALVHGSDVPAVKPQNNGAAPVDGWYHRQVQVITGAAGQAGFRTWMNNNNQSAPSSERVNLPEALSASALNQGVYVGGYWGIGQSQDIGFVIDDFEVGPTFDPTWYPGGTQPPPPPTCTTTPDVSSITYTAPGGSKAVNVAANLPTCAWSSTEALSWLAVAPVSVTGSGQVLVTADPNPGTATRVGTVTVAGRVISVSQPGTPAPPPCTFMVTPPSATVAAVGGSGTLSVTATAPTCTWTGSSAAAWLTLSDGSGTGTGEVIYSAAANPGLSRTGVLTIGGQTVMVSQDGAPVVPPPPTPFRVCTEATIQGETATGVRTIPCPETASAARGRKR